MQPTAYDRFPHLRGFVRLWRVADPSVNWRPHSRRKRNQIQLDFGFIAAKAIFHGDPAYRIAAMYLEYENVSDVDDAVVPPAFTVYEGIDYYDGLLDSANRDFLRVNLLQNPKIDAVPGYESDFVVNEGNRITCFSLSQGSVGIHGKPFSAAAQSKVFGLALVATPSPNDRTQDRVFSRTYLEPDDQLVKQASSQVGASWEMEFVPV